jgi:hypothetical protein
MTHVEAEEALLADDATAEADDALEAAAELY